MIVYVVGDIADGDFFFKSLSWLLLFSVLLFVVLLLMLYGVCVCGGGGGGWVNKNKGLFQAVS